MNEYIKKYLTVSVVVLLVVSVFAVAVGSAGSSDEGGLEGSSLEDESTSADDPIEIEGWHDLDEVRDDLNGDYILMNDLDEDTDGYNEFVDTEDGWEPIGDCDDEDVEFNGTFDGNGYEIRDLYIDRSGEDFLGLFGWSEGKLVNISLVNTNVSGDSYVGGLVGLNVGTVSNSYATGNVRGKEQVGGLVGGISHGRSHHDSIVEDSYATGDVSGEEYIGGLVGKNSGTLSDSYSTGNVIGERYVGGLVGSTLDGSTNVENSHYNIDEVLINGEHRVTLSGLFDKQYQDWMEDKELDIEDYSDSLEPAGEYYEISDVQGIRDLLGFAREDKYKFRLVDDLDLSGEQDLYIPYFGAEFEGNGYTISNLELDLPFVAFIGLFGCNDGGLVRDIELVNINMTGYFFVGGLVGYNFGTVENSHATGNVSGEDYVGGLVGSNEGTVSNSYATGNVKGSGNVGGLVGLNRDIVKNSYATGDVSGDRQVSGLVGYNSGTSTVSNSYATGDVDGETNIGGLVGVNDGSTVNNSYATGNVSGGGNVGGLVGVNDEGTFTEGTVENSYATGNVRGKEQVGGLVGYNFGTVENSFWDIETSGIEDSDGGTGLTTDEMIQKETFTDADWDFDGNWDILEGETYPFLQWQEEDTYPYQEEPGEDEDDGIPGFTTALLLLASIIAVAIYQKKSRK